MQKATFEHVTFQQESKLPQNRAECIFYVHFATLLRLNCEKGNNIKQLEPKSNN